MMVRCRQPANWSLGAMLLPSATGQGLPLLQEHPTPLDSMLSSPPEATEATSEAMEATLEATSVNKLEDLSSDRAHPSPCPPVHQSSSTSKVLNLQSPKTR